MLKNNLTTEDVERTKRKFEDFDKEQNFGLFKEDPALFARYSFKDLKNKPFTAFSYQDIILNDQSKKILLCISRQTGKSTIAAIKAIHAALLNDNYTVVVVSRTLPQSVELVRKIKVLTRTSTIPISATYPKMKEAKTEINLKNKGKNTYSRIISVPATDAARGYSADLVICDECAFWEQGDYMFNQVIEPMTQFTKGAIMLLSTPNGKHGFFWNCFNSPFWSCYQFGWEVCPNNTLEEMEEKRSRMTSMEFQAEYEAKFVASQNAYFNPKDIQKAIDHSLVMGNLSNKENIVVGVDFGKIKDNAIIYIGQIENMNLLPQEQVIKVLDRRVKPLGTNYAEVIGELKDIHDKYHPNLFVLDATGVGEGPSDIMIEYGAHVEPIKFSIQSKMNIFSNLKIFLEQSRIKIPDALALKDQLELFEYEYTISGNMKLHAPDGSHDDEVDAIALMVWGLSRVIAPPVGLTIVNEMTKQINSDECPHSNLKHKEDGELVCKACGEEI